MNRPAWLNIVCDLENAVKPKSLLLVDDCVSEIDTGFICQNVETARPAEVLRMPSNKLWDLVIVSNALENLEKREAGYLLAALRDRMSKRFVVVVPLDSVQSKHLSQWQETDLLAMGLIRLSIYDNDDARLGLYHYNIHSYKTTPNWFNNKNWAHPARWKP